MLTSLQQQLALSQPGLNYLFTTQGSDQKVGLGDLLVEIATGSAVIGVASFNGRFGIVVPESGDYTTDLVPENSNLYFTQARVLATILTGFVSNPGTVSSSDSILSAIQKLDGNIDTSLAESIHIDGSNSPSNNINWGGYEITNASIFANSLSIGSLSGILLATAGAISGSATTDDLPSGIVNLYYTAANFNASLATKTTSDLAEGSNLYFTSARAQASISATTPLTYSGGILGIQVANSTEGGYLSESDYNIFSTGSLHIDGSNSPTANISWNGNQISGLSGLLFNTDGVGDIGNPSDSRPLNIYASNSVNSPYLYAATSLTIGSLSGILQAIAGVVSGSATTTNLPEGSNLYFTPTRVLGTQLTGYISGAGTITASDTVLSAIQKLNGNIIAEEAGGSVGSVQYNNGSGGFSGGNFWTDGNNVAINNTQGFRFNGSGDANWQIGRNLAILIYPYLSPQISTNTLQFVIGNGSGEGFVFGNNGGTHYLELDSNSDAWFAHNINVANTLTANDSVQSPLYTGGILAGDNDGISGTPTIGNLYLSSTSNSTKGSIRIADDSIFILTSASLDSITNDLYLANGGAPAWHYIGIDPSNSTSGNDIHDFLYGTFGGRNDLGFGASSGGSPGAQTYFTSGSALTTLSFRTWNGASPFDQRVAQINFSASEDHSSSAFGTQFQLSLTKNGTTSNSTILTIDGTGQINMGGDSGFTTGTSIFWPISNSGNIGTSTLVNSPGGIYAGVELGSLSLILSGSLAGSVTVNAPISVTPYTLTLPNAQGAANTFLKNDGTGVLSFAFSGNLTDIGTDGIVITGGSGAVIGTGTTIAQTAASTSHNGYLSSANFTIFNNKQPAGNYITALSGDIVATGPGSVTASLVATSNSTLTTLGALSLPTSQLTGTITSAQMLPLATNDIYVGNGSNQPIAVTVSGDATLVSSGVLTLQTVNSNTGSFGSSSAIPYFTVNGKGLITAAGTNVVVAPASTLTGTTLAMNVAISSLTTLGVQAQALNMGAFQINAVANPTSAQDAATKYYVDNLVSGVASRPPAQAYSVSNVPLTGSTPLVIDGYTALNNDSIILSNQTASSQNGIYIVSITGGSYSLTLREVAEVGFSYLILDGTIYGYDSFVVSSISPTIYNQINGPTEYSFSAPLVASGTTISIAKATTSANGYLSATDWNTFNSKLTSSLSSADIFVGNGSNVATAVTVSGDATLTNTGALTLSSVATAGTTGSSTAIPVITINAKGLTTSITTVAVIAPAGTLSGTTLNSTVVTSSLTTVGTIGTGAWQGTPIGVAYGGTGTGTAFTAGSVVFAGASGVYSQNNSEFFWDNTNFRLGIGIANPATVLDIVNNSGSNSPVQSTGYGATVGYRGRYANGSLSSPTSVVSTNILNFIGGRGYGTSQFAAASTGAINIVAGETFTNSSNATYLQFMVTPTTSVTAVEAMRINSTSNVLIGTTTDSANGLLQVGSSSQFAVTSAGIVAAGIWHGTGITVPYGGTGAASFTSYMPICGGTSSTSALQSVPTGTAGYFLSYVSASALPTWTAQAPSKFRIGLSPSTAEITGASTDATIVGVVGTNTNWTEAQYATSGINNCRFVIPGSVTANYAGGAISFNITWKSTATTGNVVWNVSMVSIANGTVVDTAYGSAHSVTTAAAGTTLQQTTSTVTFTPNSTELTAGNTWLIQVQRNGGSGSDTMAAVAAVYAFGITEN